MLDSFYKEFLLSEYNKLKEEQLKRISFRDQLVYVTLAAVGTVFSFALEKPLFNETLLILPFVCIILGWTYFSNDLKITTIGNYLRTQLLPNLLNLEDQTLSWEFFHQKDTSRITRKRIQLGIDLIVFVTSGIASLIAYMFLNNTLEVTQYVIMILEFFILITLGASFVQLQRRSVNKRN